MRATSPTLSPRAQTRALIEFIRSGADELTRRWVSILRAVPAAERAAVVAAVEARVAQVYTGRAGARETVGARSVGARGRGGASGRSGGTPAGPAGAADRRARPGQVRLIGAGSGAPTKVFEVPARPRARRTG